MDCRGSDIQADRLHARVVTGAEQAVEGGGLGRLGEPFGQAGGRQRLGEHLPVELAPLQVTPGPEFGVEVAQHVRAELLLGGDTDANRAHTLGEGRLVLFGQIVAALVQECQAHDMEPDGDLPHLLHLE